MPLRKEGAKKNALHFFTSSLCAFVAKIFKVRMNNKKPSFLIVGLYSQ